MTRPARGALLRALAPLLAGVALGVTLEATDPRARLYVAAAPGLVAGLAGLLVTGVAGGVSLARRRAAGAAEAATKAAVRRVADEAVHQGRPGPAFHRHPEPDRQRAQVLRARRHRGGAGQRGRRRAAARGGRHGGSASRPTRSARSGRSWPGAGPRTAFRAPASGSPWYGSSSSATAGRSRSAAEQDRARWSASGSRCLAVPESLPMLRVCDRTVIRQARRPSSFASARRLMARQWA
jgi:hypothetical protein